MDACGVAFRGSGTRKQEFTQLVFLGLVQFGLRAQVIDALALSFEQGQIKIVNDPVLTGELMAYTSERLPSWGLE